MKIQLLEAKLRDRGLPENVRRHIRSAKIAIIDDQIDHLQGFADGLTHEGFTHLIKIEQVESVNKILEAGFDLIVLDLANVAKAISESDGIGVLKQVKEANPSQPIVVVTGSSVPASRTATLRLADLILDKPVKASDLAAAIDSILQRRKDPMWSSLEALKELRSISTTIREQLSWVDRFALWRATSAMEKKIDKNDRSIVSDMARVAEVVGKLGLVAIRIKMLCTGVPTP